MIETRTSLSNVINPLKDIHNDGEKTDMSQKHEK